MSLAIDSVSGMCTICRQHRTSRAVTNNACRLHIKRDAVGQMAQRCRFAFPRRHSCRGHQRIENVRGWLLRHLRRLAAKVRPAASAPCQHCRRTPESSSRVSDDGWLNRLHLKPLFRGRKKSPFKPVLVILRPSWRPSVSRSTTYSSSRASPHLRSGPTIRQSRQWCSASLDFSRNHS